MNNQQLDPIGLTSFSTLPCPAWKRALISRSLMERIEPLKPLRRDHPGPLSPSVVQSQGNSVPASNTSVPILKGHTQYSSLRG